jgi:protein-glutamine gamma-glutamyltransferase
VASPIRPVELSEIPGAAVAAGAPDAVDRYFEISLLGLLSTGFLTLAATGRVDHFTTAVMSLALLGRAAQLWLNHPFRLSPLWGRRLAVLAFAFFLLDALLLESPDAVLLERWLLAIVHFVFFLAVVQIFSAYRSRDYVFLAALAFAQMLAAATLTIGTTFLLCFALFLLLAISTFTSFEIRRARDRARLTASASQTAEPPADATIEHTRIARLALALSSTSLLICVGVVLLSVVLFFVIPRSNRGYFSSFSRPNDRMTGFTDEVELGQIGQIQKSSSVVMHVESSELAQNGTVKWRGIGLTNFDGKRWFNNSPQIMAIPGSRSFRFQQQTAHPGRSPRLISYTITLEPLASDSVFLAPQPMELIGPFRNLWQDDTGSVFMPGNSGALVRYSVLSDITEPSPEQLQSDADPVPPEIQKTYLQLPATDPRIPELARQVTAPYTANYDKVIALEDYLQKNYGYTLDLPSAMPADPIAYFLWDSRRGNCEFFAAALAVMLRSIGIPARLVNGFLQGQYNDLSGQYTVRGSDAHSWVEVYFSRYGWVSFDPTPAQGSASAALWFGRLNLYLDAFETFWEEWIINYDFFHQVTLARELERTSSRAQFDSRQYFQRRYRDLVALLHQRTDALLRRRLLPIALGIVLALVMLLFYGRPFLAAWFRDWDIRRRARQGKALPRDATVLYLRLLRLLARRGFAKAPGQTPKEFAESVPEPARGLVRDFTGLYLESRFGRAATAVPRLTQLLTQIQTQPR